MGSFLIEERGTCPVIGSCTQYKGPRDILLRYKERLSQIFKSKCNLVKLNNNYKEYEDYVEPEDG